MVAVPLAPPVTIPDAEPTDALLLLLVHVPPVVESESVIVRPVQTVLAVPEIAPTTPNTLSVVVTAQPAGEV